jgi:hypothetical protein
MNRKERRAFAAEAKKQVKLAGPNQTGAIIGALPLQAPINPNAGGGGGWGLPGDKGAQPATGTAPAVNPFVLPKAAGISQISQVFPTNFYIEWTLSGWRNACDTAMNMGYALNYSTLVMWAFECSPFIQSLFTKWGDAIDGTQFFVVDKKGNQLPEATKALCEQPWQMQLRKEILFSYFWGFSGLNFDPAAGKIYKYPMQNIDPINRLLKENTFSFYDGVSFADTDNLLFVQPNSSYESFLGLMQPITRSFIMMNMATINWLQAGRRLAFPILALGYPQASSAIENGVQINPLKLQAEEIAATIDPSKAVVYPYTINPAGEVQKSIEIDFEQPGGSNNMFKIYSEFNDDYKNEIRELVLGGTLSSSGSKSGSGSRSLGEVHERMFKQVIKSKLVYVLAVLNGEYKTKISKFYKGLPDGWSFEYNKAEQFTLEEMTSLSGVLNANSKQLTNEFFEANGVNPDFFQDAPQAAAPAGTLKPVLDPDPDVNIALPAGRTILKKKAFW